MSDVFDLVVLGGGSGGIAAAIRAARLGKRVAVLEPGDLGGTCVHVGCVPKKIMWIAADTAHTLAHAHTLGFQAIEPRLDWPALIACRQQYVENARASYTRRCAELGIEVITEAGRFIAHDRVAAGARELQARHILIATGGRSVRPKIPGAELGIDSNGFFALRAAPARVAVVGGGYIGVELAGVLRGLGSEVDLFVRGTRVLEAFDAEVSTHLAGSLRDQGIGLHIASNIAAVERNGGDGVRLRFDDGREPHEADVLLWATGRRPASDALGLDVVGVRCDPKGHILVDGFQATSVPGIHAVGDVTTQPALTPAATATARGLVDRLFGSGSGFVLDPEQVPTVVFSHPPTASIGLSEEEAVARFGREAVQVYRRHFRPMRSAIAGDEARTFLKMVCVDADERVVGLHMHGRDVDEMLQGFAVALRAGARKADFDATLAIHPTAAEEVVLMH